VILNDLGEADDLRVKFRRDRSGAEALERVDQSVGKAVQAVSVFDDAFALDVVEDFADSFGREFVIIEERDEARDGAFEVDVVLPERVVGVDEEGWGSCVQKALPEASWHSPSSP